MANRIVSLPGCLSSMDATTELTGLMNKPKDEINFRYEQSPQLATLPAEVISVFVVCC